VYLNSNPPSPHIYRCGTRVTRSTIEGTHLKLPLAASEEAPRAIGKLVELAWVRPKQDELPPTSALIGWLLGGPFDSCEAERCVLIGR
jgi:hypothetical protein